MNRRRITLAGLCFVGLMLLAGCQSYTQSGNQPEKAVEIEEAALEKQLKLILEQEKKWNYDYRKKESVIYRGAQYYYYMISDLDQNGRIEIFCQTYQGNGHIPVNDYFEVNEEMDGLNHITFDSETEDSDNIDFGDWSAVFIDEETDTWHYSLSDWAHGSAVDHSDIKLDVTLRDGKLTANGYCSWEMRGNSKSGTGKSNRLGWKYDFYDQKGRKISAAKFFEIYYRDHFQSMTEKTAQFSWFQTIDKEAYEDDVTDVRNISDGELYEKMKASYQAFGFTEKRKSANEQIELIADCREQWMPWERGSTDLEPEQYSFLVADMDNNGQLELIVSFCGGSGNVSQNYYYEVNDTGDALLDITPEVEHETDWLGGSSDYREPLVTTYEENTGDTSIRHYSVTDAVWGGSGNGECFSQDVYLLDHELHVTDFAVQVSKHGKNSYYRIEEGIREKITKKEYGKLQKKHFENLGETAYPEKSIFYWFSLSDKMSEEELIQKLENGFMNWMYNGDERYE